MTKFDEIKTKATQAWSNTLETLTGFLGMFLGGVFAFAILTISLTLGLVAVGFAALLLLIALPFGGLNALRDKPAEAA